MNDSLWRLDYYSIDSILLFMLPTTTHSDFSWFATYYCRDLSSLGMVYSSIFMIVDLQKLISYR